MMLTYRPPVRRIIAEARDVKNRQAPMPSRAATWGLYWDNVFAEAAVADQRWVLSTMQKHGRSLVTVLWRILGDESDVCDAYQDTFLQLAHYEGGAKPQNVKAFVFRTASNVAFSLLRRKKIHHRALRELAGRAGRAQQPDQSGELDSLDLQASLREQIARLPQQLRSVIVLRDLAEMSYPQVAGILGISVGTARVYRCRGIRLLAGRMTRRSGKSHEAL